MKFSAFYLFIFFVFPEGEHFFLLFCSCQRMSLVSCRKNIKLGWLHPSRASNNIKRTFQAYFFEGLRRLEAFSVQGLLCLHCVHDVLCTLFMLSSDKEKGTKK